MKALLFLSDVTLDPLVKELKQILGEDFNIDARYEEDIVVRLLGLVNSSSDLDSYDLLFIHTDQLFHQKQQAWQKTFLDCVKKISVLYRKNVLVSNSFTQSFALNPLKTSVGRIYDTAFEYSEQLKNATLESNIFFFDFLNTIQKTGIKHFYNYNLGLLYQMPYTKTALKEFAHDLAEELKFLFSEEKKVIIVDCDNTLWKGIVGEDGVDGIICDKNADGLVHYNLQLFLKNKKEEGFLLCICSKNNEADVKEVFDKKHFPLNWNDFILKKINWNDKIQNITEIGRELNLGVSSFIFIDDNLFELRSISELVKGISCFHLSGKYDDLLTMTDNYAFRKKVILQADKEKTHQYETERLRKEQEEVAGSLDEFIANLDIRMDIRVNDVDDFPRLSQMTGKTNQFNFNKKDLSEAQLNEFIAHGKIYSLKVTDKYGDYGTVGLILVDIKDNNSAVIENYLMSCRALGKRIEYDFYSHVVNSLAKENVTLKNIRFKQTEKNIPAQNFLKTIQHGIEA